MSQRLPNDLRETLERYNIIDPPKVPTYDKLAEAITKRNGAYRTATNLEKVTIAGVGLPGGTDKGLVWEERAAVDPALALCMAFCAVLVEVKATGAQQSTFDMGAAATAANPRTSQPGEEDLGDQAIEVEVLELPATSTVEDGWQTFTPRQVDADRWRKDGTPGGVRLIEHEQGSGEHLETYTRWEILDGYRYVPDVGSGPGWISGPAQAAIAPKWGPARPAVSILYLDEELDDNQGWTSTEDAVWQEAGWLVDDLDPDGTLLVKRTEDQATVWEGAVERGLRDRPVLIRLSGSPPRQSLATVVELEDNGPEGEIVVKSATERAPVWYDLPVDAPAVDEEGPAPDPRSVAAWSAIGGGNVAEGVLALVQPADGLAIMVEDPGPWNELYNSGDYVLVEIGGHLDGPFELQAISFDYSGIADGIATITLSTTLVEGITGADDSTPGAGAESPAGRKYESATAASDESTDSREFSPDDEEDQEVDQPSDEPDLSSWTLGATAEDVEDLETARVDGLVRKANAAGYNLERVDGGRQVVDAETRSSMSREWLEKNFGGDEDPEDAAVAVPKIEKPKRKSRSKPSTE